MSTQSDSDGPAVRVEPARLEWLEALVQGDAVFGERFSVDVVDGWAGFPEALEPTLEAVRHRDPGAWGPHLLFDATDGALVGFGGFKGAPVDGRVEIGYAIAPARRGRGLATASTRELVRRAHEVGVAVVVAHTLAEPNASTAVLTRCGFRRTGEVTDEDLGEPVWRWELEVSSGAGVVTAADDSSDP